MAHDVFISYSTRDRVRAEAVCAALETAGLVCWMAPRDVVAGTPYAASLVDAVAEARIVVLIFSTAAMTSDGVMNELELAFNRARPVLAVRIEDVQPAGAAEFYLRRHHWFDAYGRFESRVVDLPAVVRRALAAPNAPAARPAEARAASVVRLPRQTSSFVGRTDAVERVVALLQEDRLVTIVGTGGVGKTRLAIRAVESLEDLGEGAWFVDLEPVSDATHVVASMLAALGGAQSSERGDLDGLLEFLGERRLLVLLDNSEHLIAQVAATVEAVLERCPNVTILATSREALHVAGEFVYRLEPLNESTALNLFTERARAANGRFELTSANEAVVRDICRRVDGIALAIELAAARVRMISVDEIARRLDDRFRLLTGGSRTALPRRQTVHALIDWSYDLLTETERALFRRAGIFSGGFTLDALTTVCTDAESDSFALLDLLGALVDKSLIVAEIETGDQRYRMLQTIFEYAGEKLGETGEAPALAERHAQSFTTFARNAYEEWDTAPSPDWHRRVRNEIHNVRAALHWTLAQANDPVLGADLAGSASLLLLRLSLVSEGIAWCERGLAVPTLPLAVEARLRYGISMLYNDYARYGDAADAAERAARIYASGEDARALTRACAQVAQLRARQGRRDEAASFADRAIESARKLGDPRLLASTLQRCGAVYAPEQIAAARLRFEESVALFRQLGRDDETARALTWWAVAESAAGEAQRALDLTLDAATLESEDDRVFSSTAATCYYLALRRDDDAAASARTALALVAADRHPILLPMIVTYVAASASDLDLEAAARVFGYGDARLRAAGWHYDATSGAVRERFEARLDAQLGTARFDALREEGARWSEDQTLEAAARF